tara:strand:- start:3 stop:479 length:477 start_codon:yes stop_codon:yes gene_type:complete
LNYSIKSKEHLNWLHEHHIELDLTWTKVAIEDHFKNKKALNLFAIEKKTLGLILGHFLYQDQKSIEYEILHLAVLKKYRGKGVGFLLLSELEKQLKTVEKCIKIYLEVRVENKFAIKLYQKLGYKAYNERKNYYRSKSINSPNSQDAILFVKSLNAIS